MLMNFQIKCVFFFKRTYDCDVWRLEGRRRPPQDTTTMSTSVYEETTSTKSARVTRTTSREVEGRLLSLIENYLSLPLDHTDSDRSNSSTPFIMSYLPSNLDLVDAKKSSSSGGDEYHHQLSELVDT